MNDRTEHRWAVDGIEEGIARIEADGEHIMTVPAYLLPSGAKEGQFLRVTSAPTEAPDVRTVTISIDDAGTASALRKSKATMRESMAASKQKDPGGDVTL